MLESAELIIEAIGQIIQPERERRVPLRKLGHVLQLSHTRGAAIKGRLQRKQLHQKKALQREQPAARGHRASHQVPKKVSLVLVATVNHGGAHSLRTSEPTCLSTETLIAALARCFATTTHSLHNSRVKPKRLHSGETPNTKTAHQAILNSAALVVVVVVAGGCWWLWLWSWCVVCGVCWWWWWCGGNGPVPVHWSLRLDCPAGNPTPVACGSRFQASPAVSSTKAKARKKVARLAHLSLSSWGDRGSQLFPSL